MKISVVVATYNGEKYIYDQLKSIVEQTVKPDEIIICDDSSKDRTVSIINGYLKNSGLCYKIITHKYNKGVVESFKDAINESSGDVIFFCDQDDFWYSRKIESFMKVFECNPTCTVVFSNADIVDSNLNESKITLWETLHFSLNNKIVSKNTLMKEMLRRNIFTGMCMAVARRWLLELPEFSANMLHDEYIGWCALLFGEAVPLNESLVAYRQHTNNVVGSQKKQKFESIKIAKEYIKQSSIKTLKKYGDLLEIVSNIEDRHCLESAYKFYGQRVDIFSQNKFYAFRKYCLSIIKKEYARYCSNTENAKLKDLICIIF